MDAVARVKRARKLQNVEKRRVRKLIAVENQYEAEFRATGRATATAQTVAKLEPHAIETMLSRGVLSDDDAVALDEIARAYAILTWDVNVRMSKLERVDGTPRHHGDIPGSVRLVSHYAQWWDMLKDRREQACLPVAVDVAVDGLSLNAIARKRNIDKRTAKMKLRTAIDIWFQVGRRRKPRSI